ALQLNFIALVLGRYMATLRLKQSTVRGKEYCVDLSLEGHGWFAHRAGACFTFDFGRREQEELRWYLEDFLQSPYAPAPQSAARIEGHIHDVGLEIFHKVFESSDDARKLWRAASARLEHTRIEIETGAGEGIPWELMVDPGTGRPLAVTVRAFVRVPPGVPQPARLRIANASQRRDRPIRILLVICRPGGAADVPFRSVAGRLLKGLSETASGRFQLHVLRPPSFGALAQTLNTAKANGWPYDIVHFDGHGTYKEPTSAQRKRGFLLFENPEIYGNQEDIHGELLGRTLAAAGTGLLVLNACRSAYSEPLSQPGEDLPDDKSRAFGSLAEEVLAAGVSGVVAMQYNVYVVTAAGFVGGVYAGIAEGRSLGEAVTLGRRRLADSPMRAGGIEPISLQDWTVPVVYETPALVSDPGDAGRGRSLLSPIRKVW